MEITFIKHGDIWNITVYKKCLAKINKFLLAHAENFCEKKWLWNFIWNDYKHPFSCFYGAGRALKFVIYWDITISQYITN